MDNSSEDREITILSYVNNSFEQDLSFIDGLVKTRFRSGFRRRSFFKLFHSVYGIVKTC